MEATLTSRFLLLAVITVLPAEANTNVTSGPVPVQKPFNLRKVSYNFNTTLYWDYDTTSMTPYFQVEYRDGAWTVVESCRKISHTHCDLSDEIVDPYVHYDVRVKAFVGSEVSEYSKTEIYLIDDGIIGPPSLNASYDEKFIYIDVLHPQVPHDIEIRTVRGYVKDLVYYIYYENETQEMENDCDDFGCTVEILITNQTRFCFAAQGTSDSVPMTMEKSKEICISITATHVQQPFNLRKISYNFNTTLHWDYDITSVAPYFQVEYRNGAWMIVESCRKISHNYCDLSEKIIDPYVHYHVRVKAFVGSEESEYARTEIYLINDGIIGPPSLNSSNEEKLLIIDFWHPLVPLVNGKKTVGDYVDDLEYNIYYENETKNINECDKLGCDFKILIQNKTRYCFSVQGTSNLVPMTMEKSKETCISTTATHGIPKKLYAIIISTSVVMLFLLFLTVFIIRKKIEARSMFPKSLGTVKRVLRTQVYVPTDQITLYDPVSVSPADSPDERITQEVDKDLSVSDDSETRESIDHGYHSSAGETEQKSVENLNDKEESSNNYYHTENSDSSIVCVKNDDANEPEPVRDIKPVTNSFGYDRPHCL